MTTMSLESARTHRACAGYTVSLYRNMHMKVDDSIRHVVRTVPKLILYIQFIAEEMYGLPYFNPDNVLRNETLV